MELIFPFLLCLMISPCKTMNQPEEKPNSVDPDHTEATEKQDVGQPGLTLVSTNESQGAQAAVGRDRDNDINPRPNSPDIDLLADAEQKGPQDTLPCDVGLGKAKDHDVRTSTKETAKTEDEYRVEHQVLEEEQITSDILKLAKEKRLLFTATQRPARNVDENDYYEVEQNEELDSRQRNILNDINWQGLREIERKKIESSFGTIEMLPSKDTTVFSGNGYTIYQGTPTSEMEFFNNLTRITGLAVLIHVMDQVDFFVFVDPAGQRFCLIFTVSLSDLNPEYFQWFLSEKLLAVMSEVITFSLNGISGFCDKSLKLETFLVIMALLFMICFILGIELGDYINPHLDEIEVRRKIDELKDGSQMAMIPHGALLIAGQRTNAQQSDCMVPQGTTETLMIYNGDVTRITTVVIVRWVNPDLTPWDEVSRSVEAAAGIQLTVQLEEIIRIEGLAAYGSVVVTDAGCLPYKKIFNLVGPCDMAEGFRKCLREAVDRKFKSIAFPHCYKISPILKIVRLVREEGHRFVRKLFAKKESCTTTDCKPVPPSGFRNKQQQKKGRKRKNVTASQQSPPERPASSKKGVTKEKSEISLGKREANGGNSPGPKSSSGGKGERRTACSEPQKPFQHHRTLALVQEEIPRHTGGGETLHDNQESS